MSYSSKEPQRSTGIELEGLFLSWFWKGGCTEARHHSSQSGHNIEQQQDVRERTGPWMDINHLQGTSQAWLALQQLRPTLSEGTYHIP